MIDLENSSIRADLAESISCEIDEFCETHFNDGFRKHLGASVIGKSCSRQLWYAFRWAQAEKIDGRTHRIFERGRREEELVWTYLRGIGCEVHDLDPDTQKQWRVSVHDGHFGGSMDARIKLPAKYGIDEWILAEVKTMSDTNWNRMVKEKVKVNKPEYWAQMNIYGYLSEPKMRYALFIAVNKNNDSIHFELLKLDEAIAIDYIGKARDIVFAQEPPTKVAFSPANFICKFCPFSNICHYDQVVERNCRSCKYAKPGPDGSWLCGVHGDSPIPEDFIPLGCANHKGID